MVGFIYQPGAVPMVGWADYNDSATSTMPLALSIAGVDLTNDALGPFTTSAHWLDGVDEIWDATNNRFDFSGLDIGDTVDIRVDLTVSVSGLNTQIATRLDMAIGGNPYSLTVDTSAFLFTGTYQIVKWFSFYIGDNNTRNNPAKLHCSSSDATGDTCVVNGWYVRVIKGS